MNECGQWESVMTLRGFAPMPAPWQKCLSEGPSRHELRSPSARPSPPDPSVGTTDPLFFFFIIFLRVEIDTFASSAGPRQRPEFPKSDQATNQRERANQGQRSGRAYYPCGANGHRAKDNGLTINSASANGTSAIGSPASRNLERKGALAPSPIRRFVRRHDEHTFV